MKNDDHPPGVLKMQGGDIYKTHVTDFCYQDSDKEGWYLWCLLQVEQEAGQEEEEAELNPNDVPVRKDQSFPLLRSWAQDIYFLMIKSQNTQGSMVQQTSHKLRRHLRMSLQASRTCWWAD